jgi:hypothetical protein
LLAVTANSATRSVAAFTAGGRAYGTRVAASLLASTAMALLVAWPLIQRAVQPL